jgi:hypothetical protein
MVKDVMLTSGADISKVDPAVFFWKHGDGQLRGVLACHVDDFLWGGDKTFENGIINTVRAKFCVGKEKSKLF